MNSPAPIWVLDDITVRAGQGPAFLAAYLERCAPTVTITGCAL